MKYASIIILFLTLFVSCNKGQSINQSTSNDLVVIGSSELDNSLSNNPVNEDSPLKKDKLSSSTSDEIITLEELFANKNEYANKTIRVRGKVVKYNSGIMGYNWIHLQDGTDYSGKNDLTITSKMETELDKTVTIEGKITLDKDIGSGYFYDVIMESGIIVK